LHAIGLCKIRRRFIVGYLRSSQPHVQLNFLAQISARGRVGGLQSVYLTEVGRPFANALFTLIGAEANQVTTATDDVSRDERLSPALEPTLDEWERRVEVKIRAAREEVSACDGGSDGVTVQLLRRAPSTTGSSAAFSKAPMRFLA